MIRDLWISVDGFECLMRLEFEELSELIETTESPVSRLLHSHDFDSSENFGYVVCPKGT